MRFGVHMPQTGGFKKNVERVANIGCGAIQIFPGNPTGWKMGKLDQEELAARADLLDQHDLHPLVVHAAYLINLATNNEDFLAKSKQLLNETMERAAFYRAPFVVLHTGNHGGMGIEQGLAQIIASIEEAMPVWPETVKLLLENTAGSGTALGSNFEQLAEILSAFPKGKIGVCIDTAHSWAAGYDMGSAAGVKETLNLLDNYVGLEQLHTLHINDTKVERGSRVDRHAHIGEGNIGLEGFGTLLNYGWPDELPIILETPDMGTDRDKENLDRLRDLVR
ncbi:MAG: deoxyribonuclease IV [Dethiobacteria bacterium]|nr:deoxyribonuclease IV [Dethiobacteria bacterium]